jgi:DNA-3-methyladenine glycosylase I
MDGRERCSWVKDDPLFVAYHDDEWGRPVHDDRVLFELLLLEGAQAGLSWDTILRKRPGYRDAFAGFDPNAVARFGPQDVERLLGNEGIVRHRGKIESAILNAKLFLALQREHGSFDAFVWRFVGGAPKVNRWATSAQVPASTKESDALSKELKKRGFKFVGTTICYAFMQACGLVNDHVRACYLAPPRGTKTVVDRSRH